MENSPKMPTVAIVLATILLMITLGSFVKRTGAGAQGEGTAARGDVPNGNYGGQRFFSQVVEQKVEVVADPSGGLRWTQPEYTATAGAISFVVNNPSPVVHQIGIEGADGQVNYQSPNFNGRTTNTYTIMDLPPGEYQVVCNVPGHSEGGMVSKLIVRPA